MKLEEKNDPIINIIEIMLARKYTIFIGFFIVFGIVAFGALKMPPSYEAYTKIYITPPTVPRVEAPYIRDMNDRSLFGNQIELIKSRAVRLKVVKKLNLDKVSIPFGYWQKLKNKIKDIIYPILKIQRRIPDPTEMAMTFIRSSINAIPSRGTNIVTIYANTESPEFSALLANFITETYVEYANNLMYDKADNAYSYIENEIENARKKLDESEKALNNFKSKKNIYSLSNESSNIANKLTKLEDEKNQIQLQIENPKKRIDNQELKTLNEQLVTMRRQMELLLINHKAEHPDVKILKSSINKIRAQLIKAKAKTDNNRNEISTKELNELLLKKNDISQQIKKLKERNMELAKLQVELDKKTREYFSNRQRLNELTSKIEEASILKANEMKHGTIRILERAVTPIWSATKKKKILFSIGTLVALIFSLGMAFAAEYLDDSITTPDEVEQYLNLPMIGTLPKITRKLRKM